MIDPIEYVGGTSVIDGMVQGYLDCQLWAGLDIDSGDDDNTPTYDENYSVSDISESYIDAMREEFEQFVEAHPLAVKMFLNRTTVMGVMRNVHTPEQFGHDYYLTREHHGTGFWDRGLGDLGDYLTDISEYAGGAAYLHENESGELIA